MDGQQHWKDCQEWKSINLQLSTTSNEACKLFDALVTQFASGYQNQQLGGMVKTSELMLKADPEFVMGHVITLFITIIGGASNPLTTDSSTKQKLEDLSVLVEKQKHNLQWRELQYAEAIEQFGSHGLPAEACNTLNTILLFHPNDILAIRIIYFLYTNIGYQHQALDSLARVVPQWNEHMPLYSSLLGMYAFSLVEQNLFDKGEKMARKGLLVDSNEASCIHSMAHVFEETGRPKEGVDFMNSTVQLWGTDHGVLTGHITWHWALYYVEKGEFEAALDLFDNKLHNRLLKKKGILDIIDTSSLLFRLELEGVNIGCRWKDIYELCESHIDDHYMAFQDIHFLLAFLGDKQQDTVKVFMNSIENYMKGDVNSHNLQITKMLGYDICTALVAYDNQDYTTATDILYPLKYKFVSIGKSNAQRDLLNQVLIHSAMKSSKPEHVKLARSLILERKAFNEESCLSERLMNKILASHTH